MGRVLESSSLLLISYTGFVDPDGKAGLPFSDYLLPQPQLPVFMVFPEIAGLRPHPHLLLYLHSV